MRINNKFSNHSQTEVSPKLATTKTKLCFSENKSPNAKKPKISKKIIFRLILPYNENKIDRIYFV